MKSVLVTGVNGFVGKHLTNALIKSGHTVYGIGLQPEPHKLIASGLYKYFAVDLTDQSQVNRLPLAEIDGVINLAGLANVGASFNDAKRYMTVNVAVVDNLANAIRASGKKIRHLAISTGAVYDPSQKPPFVENSNLVAVSSPYVMSKIAMEERAANHRRSGEDIIIARPFNHIGPGQETGFLLPDLIFQVKQSIASNSPIMVGNLSTKRDYTDVRDVVQAYVSLLAAENLSHDTYNICSGKSIEGTKLLELVINSLHPSSKPQVVVDPKKFRPSDAPDIYGSADKLRRDTGWQPTIALEQTISDTLASSL